MTEEELDQIRETVNTAMASGESDNLLETLALLSPVLALIGVALGWGLERYGSRRDRLRKQNRDDLKAAMRSLSDAFRRLNEFHATFGTSDRTARKAALDEASDAVAALSIDVELIAAEPIRDRAGALNARMLQWSMSALLPDSTTKAAPEEYADELGREWAALAVEYGQVMAVLGSELRSQG